MMKNLPNTRQRPVSTPGQHLTPNVHHSHSQTMPSPPRQKQRRQRCSSVDDKQVEVIRFISKLRKGSGFLKYGRMGKPHVRFVCVSKDLMTVYWGKLLNKNSQKVDVEFNSSDSSSARVVIKKKKRKEAKECALLDTNCQFSQFKTACSGDIVRVLVGRQTDVFRRYTRSSYTSQPKQPIPKPPPPSSPPPPSHKQQQQQQRVHYRPNHGNQASAAITKQSLRKLAMENTNARLYPLSFSVVFKHRTLDLDCKSSEERDAWVVAFRWLRRFATGVSFPFLVRHVTHVSPELIWSGPSAQAVGEDLEKSFKLGKLLGAGTFGRVYAAFSTHTQSNIAVKLVFVDDTQSSDEIKREVNIMKLCTHPNIVNYYGCWGPDSLNRLWILMQHCEMGSIIDLMLMERKRRLKFGLYNKKKRRKLLKRKQQKSKPSDQKRNLSSQKNESKEMNELRECAGILSEKQLAFILYSSLLALQYLHNSNPIIVHRDIKARNLLVTQAGEIKLTDFGISKAIFHQQGNSFKGKSLAMGSPFWMAPEAVKEKPQTPQADVWSLGITAIELAEGLPPNAHLSSLEAMKRTISEPAPSLKYGNNNENSIFSNKPYSRHFVDFISKCLVKEARKRWTVRQLLSHPLFSSFHSSSVSDHHQRNKTTNSTTTTTTSSSAAPVSVNKKRVKLTQESSGKQLSKDMMIVKDRKSPSPTTIINRAFSGASPLWTIIKHHCPPNNNNNNSRNNNNNQHRRSKQPVKSNHNIKTQRSTKQNPHHHYHRHDESNNTNHGDDIPMDPMMIVAGLQYHRARSPSPERNQPVIIGWRKQRGRGRYEQTGRLPLLADSDSDSYQNSSVYETPRPTTRYSAAQLRRRKDRHEEESCCDDCVLL